MNNLKFKLLVVLITIISTEKSYAMDGDKIKREEERERAIYQYKKPGKSYSMTYEDPYDTEEGIRRSNIRSEKSYASSYDKDMEEAKRLSRESAKKEIEERDIQNELKRTQNDHQHQENYAYRVDTGYGRARVDRAGAVVEGGRV